MAPYVKHGHSKTLWITVRLASGKRLQLPTGTHDDATARDMELMLHTLGRRGSRDWDLVRALSEWQMTGARRRRRLVLARLYDHWQAHTLDELRAELTDVDLAPSVDGWLAHLARAGRSTSTLDGYRYQIAHLAPLGADGERAPLWRSTLTPAWIAARRDSAPGGIPSQLAHLTAWSSWCSYLVERDVLKENPVSRVKWPKLPRKGDRIRYINRLADVQRFVASMPTVEDRAIAALRESTGADWDGIQPMRREHVIDPSQRLVFLPGDKTGNRAREVEVEPWAWPHVAAYLAATRTMLPGAKLFTVPYPTYKSRHDRTRAALIAAGVAIPKGYSPHNARHSFAVRKRRAGWPDWKIAEYLGNTAEQVASTYGRFRPTREDMRQDRAGGADG